MYVDSANANTVATIELDRRMINLFIDMQSTQSERTAKVYASTINGFASHIAKPLAHVTVEDVHAYAQSLSHLAPTTQHRMLSTIKSFYRFLHSQPPYNALPNAVEVYRLPKLKQTQEIERVLTKDEVESIRDVLRYRNLRNFTLVSTLFGTGCRISEILDAKWCDVMSDLDGNVGLSVIGKGKKQRTVKLTPQLFTLICQYRQTVSLDTAIGSGDESPLFINRNGDKLTSRYVEQVVSDAANIAGLKKNVTPHYFRHTHASYALYNGADIFKVKESLGHASVQTSIRYLHTLKKLESTTADFIEMD